MTKYYVTYSTGYSEEVGKAVAEAAFSNPYVSSVTEESDDFQLEDINNEQ